MGDDEKGDSTVKNEAQQEIAASGGKVAPAPETANSLFTLRQICDEHAILLAKGEQEIQRFLGGLFERFAADVKQAVALEQAQCELLLRLEQPIPHGQRADWKWELAQSLNNSRLGIGNRFSVSGIEERLTRARAAQREPGYWVRIESACLTTKSLNFRAAMKTLKASESEEEEEKPKQPRDPGAGRDGGAEGDGGGGHPDDDDGGDEGTAGDPPAGVPMSSLPTEELQQLRADVDAADKIEDERNALRAEIEKLTERIAGLEEENRDLQAISDLSGAIQATKEQMTVDVSIDKPGKIIVQVGQTVGIPAGVTAMQVHKASSHTEEILTHRKTPKIQRLPRGEAEIEFLATNATKESHDVH